jgi:hypothetical protein
MVDIPQTPNFKLYKPPFDRRAWHRYINDNMSTIDAVLTTYLDVGNIVGVWENSTAYLVGERTIDPDVGQVFEAAVNHTSSAGPATFAEDRTANPTFWTSLAVTARGLGAWAPGILYQPNDFVVDGTVYAVCITTHTSGAIFANDAVYWDYLIDVSSLPVIPSITGKSLQLLRVNAGETTTEWATVANIQAWLGLGSAAYEPTSTFAVAAHNHTVANVSDMSADARLFVQAANDAAMRTELGLGALAVLATVGTSQIDADAVTYAKIQNVTDARLLGRSAGSSGDAQEITVGSGLLLASGQLKAVPLRYYDEYTTSTDLTTTVPLDDTVPTSSEGTQILSRSATTTTDTQRVRIRVNGMGECASSGAALIMALFRGSTCVQVADFNVGAGLYVEERQLCLEYEEQPGAAGSYTYSVRVGASAGNCRMNGTSTARLFGGAAKTTMVIEVFEP